MGGSELIIRALICTDKWTFIMCLGAPQTAAGLSGDCTFEIDECGWANVAGRTDEMDWERRLGSNARTPISDHTLGAATGKDKPEAVLID